MKKVNGVKFGKKDIVVHNIDESVNSEMINQLIEEDKELMQELAKQEEKERLMNEKEYKE
mgnify:CR=1 FL=1